MINITSVLGALATLAALSQAGAEAAPDWEQARSEDGAVIALSRYDNGLGIGVRCSDGALHAMIDGLPPAEGDERSLRTSFRGEPPTTQPWLIGTTSQIAYHRLPSVFARQLRQGGELRVGVPGAGANGATLVYAVDLPASDAAINAVLEACDRPLIDPHDAASEGQLGELPEGMEWSRRPRPDYPTGRTFNRGYVAVVCITTQQGELQDCRVEMELPARGGFGEAALDSLRDARVRSVDGSDFGVRQINTNFHFRMEGESRSTGTTRGSSLAHRNDDTPPDED